MKNRYAVIAAPVRISDEDTIQIEPVNLKGKIVVNPCFRPLTDIHIALSNHSEMHGLLRSILDIQEESHLSFRYVITSSRDEALRAHFFTILCRNNWGEPWNKRWPKTNSFQVLNSIAPTIWDQFKEASFTLHYADLLRQSQPNPSL